ncbi:hypothetical protein [Pseudogemmobacter humi]|uniref:Uncharacterized protein n=1 Tax=Pseudogemmobacter humi TaxID=2483812 RepID=A0A3P5XB15_9RHOB|nr:hypothetical protein [Pseudogemmobacter humi]VDC31845.1 hypothetical protein XINFAN_03191 [Pseudogemmobacter humi]
MSSRRYIKRVWRVPKDRGALDYFATLVVKALVKHGWPARWELAEFTDGFVIYEQGATGPLPSDMQRAAEIAVRIVARTYRVDVTQFDNWVGLNRSYTVTASGHFKEVKT